MKIEEEAASQGTCYVIHVINRTPDAPVPELAATLSYSFVCIDLEFSAILTLVHALILTSCDNSVHALVMGRDAECRAYLRLLQESLEDTDFTVYSMMLYNTAQETNRYRSHTIHMNLVVPEGCHTPKVCVMCPFVSCTTCPVHPPCYIYYFSRCRVVPCTIHLTYIMCLRTSCAI